MQKLCVICFRLYLCEKLIASETMDGQSTIGHFWSYLSTCHKFVFVYLLFVYLQICSFFVQTFFFAFSTTVF